MVRKQLSSILLISLILLISGYPAYSENQQEKLKQYLEELQRNPGDNALREKIIRHVETMNPTPEIPDDARKYIVRGRTAAKSATDVDGFKRAAQEFREAIKLAPWLAEGYYNLAVVQDKAGEYDEAVNNLKLYLSAAPNATDSQKVKDLIYEIEYRKEETKRAESKEQLERQKRYDMTQGLAGVWKNPDSGRVYNATVKDDQFEAKAIWAFRGKIIGSSIEGLVAITAEYIEETSCTNPPSSEPWTGTISSDAKQITIKYRQPTYMANWNSGGLLFPKSCNSVTFSHYTWENMKLVR